MVGSKNEFKRRRLGSLDWHADRERLPAGPATAAESFAWPPRAFARLDEQSRQRLLAHVPTGSSGKWCSV